MEAHNLEGEGIGVDGGRRESGIPCVSDQGRVQVEVRVYKELSSERY